MTATSQRQNAIPMQSRRNSGRWDWSQHECFQKVVGAGSSVPTRTITQSGSQASALENVRGQSELRFCRASDTPIPFSQTPESGWPSTLAPMGNLEERPAHKVGALAGEKVSTADTISSPAKVPPVVAQIHLNETETE